VSIVKSDDERPRLHVSVHYRRLLDLTAMLQERKNDNLVRMIRGRLRRESIMLRFPGPTAVQRGIFPGFQQQHPVGPLEPQEAVLVHSDEVLGLQSIIFIVSAFARKMQTLLVNTDEMHRFDRGLLIPSTN